MKKNKIQDDFYFIPGKAGSIETEFTQLFITRLSGKNYFISATRNLEFVFYCSTILYPLRGKFSLVCPDFYQEG